MLDPDTLAAVPADGLTIGEVMVRGNVVMKGYLGNEKATNDTFKGGWFHTGDLAVHHGNGRIELKDRSKDIIISGGENVSSIQVENRLLMHEVVGEAAVLAKDDEKWGEVPVAFLVVRSGTSAVIVNTNQGNLGQAATTSATAATSEATSETTTVARFGNALQIGDTTLTSLDMIAWARTKMAGGDVLVIQPLIHSQYLTHSLIKIHTRHSLIKHTKLSSHTFFIAFLHTCQDMKHLNT